MPAVERCAVGRGRPVGVWCLVAPEHVCLVGNFWRSVRATLSPRALLEPSGKRHGLSLCHWTEVSVAIVLNLGCQVCGADSVAELMGGGKEQRRGSAYERYARC